MTPHPSSAAPFAVPDAVPSNAPRREGLDPARRARRDWEPWATLLLGPPGRGRLSVATCLLAASMYAAWTLMIWLYALPQGLLSRDLALLFLVLEIGGMSFYPLARSGVTRHCKDPALSIVQMLWASITPIVGYAAVPESGPAELQILCLILVFGFLSLRPRQALWMGALMAAQLVAMLGVMAALDLPHFDVADEAGRVLGACAILGLLAHQAHRFAVLRRRVADEKKQLGETMARLQALMLHDTLTGLPNRQHMQARLEAECERARQCTAGLTVALIDLDHFKRVNDTHGHAVGDEVLVAFARQACALLRQTDLVGRWGGEEFLVLMPDTRPATAGVAGLARLRQGLAGMQASQAVPGLRLEFSAGVVAHVIGESPAALLDRADRALYRAKALGRGRNEVDEG